MWKIATGMVAVYALARNPDNPFSSEIVRKRRLSNARVKEKIDLATDALTAP